LLGLFTFGLFTQRHIKGLAVPLICIASPILSYLISLNSEAWFNGYKFGIEILILNGLITFMGLLTISKK